ncbi:MAG TPA: VOC family protein [Candidatus Angelobacter sp.]|nr:VOC family protein [Candidatus Angelobacter sp.]
MLNSAKIVGFVPTRDPQRARAFYEDILSRVLPRLRFLRDDHFALVFESDGTMVRIAHVPEFTPMPFTILGWEVDDIQQAVQDLKNRGVHFELYEQFQQEESGIWTAPGGAAKVAWFKDPDGNVLSLSQHAA